MKALSRVQIAFPLAAFLLATAGLLSTVPGGTLRGFTFTTDTVPLEVAGRSTLAVIGYVDLGQQHLYVTAETLLLVVVASALAKRGGFATLAGVVLGVGAVGGLSVVTGCPCGSGAATPLWHFVR